MHPDRSRNTAHGSVRQAPVCLVVEPACTEERIDEKIPDAFDDAGNF